MKEMVYNNPLLDEVFLQKLYTYRHKEIYAKIIALDKNENQIEQIEGQVTGGSVSLDGSSNVRRSCSLTMVAKNIDINAYYWGLKNKFKLFIGLSNHIDNAYDDIIWFPFGTMVISNFSTSQSTNGYNISISGKDKMCLINGDLGGSLFASVDFGKEEYYDTQTKITTMSDIPIKRIITEAIHEYAGEPWENIIINDLDDYGLELLDYKGSTPLYLIISESGSNEDLGDVLQISLNGSMPIGDTTLAGIGAEGSGYTYNPRTSLNFEMADVEQYSIFMWDNKPVSVAKVEYGQTCGYRYTDITYAGELILSVGEPVTAMLDKLVAMLGNWEYFFDVNGKFIFQRKKTYLDKTWNNIVTNNDDSYVPTMGETYAESALWSSAVSWNFTDSFLVTAFNNTPTLNNIKNDYSIWGTKKAVSGVEYPVHLRYAIDKKPIYYKTFDGVEWSSVDDGQLKKNCDWREIIFQMVKDYRKYGHYTPYDENDGKEHAHTNAELLDFAENFSNYIRINSGKNKDGEWYYPTGKTGYEQYYTDLEGFWRQLYCPPQLFDEWYNTGVWTDRTRSGDVVTLTAPDKTEISYFISTDWINHGDASKDGWNMQVINSPATLNFWFDFLDADKDSDFAKYSVPVIGDRAKSVNDSMVKAIYFREVPNTIFTDNLATTEHKSGYTYMQYQKNMAMLFTVSTQGKCAIDVMEEWINNHVYAIESANITTVPVYHLQPNTRIKIMDAESKINGDYIVSRISIPLTYNGTMSITATKVADRIY